MYIYIYILISNLSAIHNFITISTHIHVSIIAVLTSVSLQSCMRDRSRIVPVTTDDFLYIYFTCNVSITESREPYQYTKFKYSHITSEPISKISIVVYLVVYTRRAIKFDRIKSYNQQEKWQKAAVILEVSISYAI